LWTRHVSVFAMKQKTHDFSNHAVSFYCKVVVVIIVSIIIIYCYYYYYY